MENLRAATRIIKQLVSPASAEVQQEMRYVRPFFWLVILVLAFLYGFAVYSSAALHEPIRWVIFTLLMIGHSWLHWRLPRAVYNTGVVMVYLVIQGALALALTLIAQNVTYPLALAAILIGETVGALRDVRLTIPMITLQLALALLGHITLVGWSGLPAWWMPALPVTGFVILYVTLFNRQTDARQQAQTLLSQLEEAHQKLAEYSIRVEELTRSAERERLVRDLHDTLAQGVAGLVLQLEAAKHHLDNQHVERASQIVDLSLQRARSTLSESRAAIDNLRRLAGSLDLDEMVRGHAAQFTHTSGILCEVISLLNEPVILSSAAGEHLDHILSEALFNIVRHAEASEVCITLEQVGHDTSLQIEDNGAGFNSGRRERGGRYGLLGIQERARLLGGAAKINSQPGKGTRILVRFPTPVNDRSDRLD